MADLVFIGGVGRPDEYGGELSKNKLIINRLVSLGFDVAVVDTYGSHRNPLKIIGMPFVLASKPTAPIIISTNYSNVRLLAKIIRTVFPNRTITFFAVGGRLGNEVESGKYTAKELSVFDHVIVESRTIVSQLSSCGVRNVEYLPNFKDINLAVISGGKAEGISGMLKCVFVSRIQIEKGVDIILDAIEAANLSGRKISVDFYGGIKECYHDTFFKRIGVLENVRYCGLLNFFDGSGQEVLSHYHLSLFPTFWEGEGFPGVIVDALMAGVPILASDWHFNREYISDNVGFLCRPNDCEDFRLKLFEIDDNRRQLAAMFSKCRAEGEKYDVNRLLAKDYVSRIIGRQSVDR